MQNLFNNLLKESDIMYERTSIIKTKKRGKAKTTYIQKKSIFQVQNATGYAKVVLVDGKIEEAECATWEGDILADRNRVFNKLIQISQTAFVDMYKELSTNSREFDAARRVLEKRQEKLRRKQKLTKMEREMLSL